MSLLAPLALLGLLTIPAILLLHLLRNRRPQLNIPSLRLWRGLEQKKHGELPRQIPLSLLLLLQLLMATALTFSLARPALSFILSRPRQLIFILDMTTSMLAEDVPPLPGAGAAGRRFDLALQFIRENLQAIAGQDRFAVISLDPQPQILLTGDGRQLAQAAPALDNLAPGATGLDLPAALTLANSLIDSPDRDYQIFILTDGNYAVASEPLPEMRAPVSWQIFSSGPVANQALLNVSSAALPDGRHRLFARVVNYAGAPATRTVRVSTDQAVFDEISVQLEPQAEAARVWTLPATAQTAAVELLEPDVLPLDNRAELLLAGPTRYQVLLVSNSPDLLARALAVQPGVELTVDAPDLSRHDPAGFDLVVFDGLPPALASWPAGNLLVVNPPLGHPLLPAEHFARSLRPDPDTGSTLLAGVDLSGVYFERAPQLTLPAWAKVDLSARPSSLSPAPASPLPLIFHGSVNNSRLVVWAFDLAASNLPARLAFPILTANTLSALVAPSPPPVAPLGATVLLDGNFTVETPGGQRLSPSMDRDELHRFTRTRQPGLYRIFDRRQRQVAGFAVHAGSALESNLSDPLEPAQLDLTSSSPPVVAAPQVQYQEFWPWLAGLALAVFMIEGWLAWRS
ncbi:MAG: VWA domain-containing protein [Chloroflexota bacterium]